MLKVIQSPAKYLQGPDAAVLFGQYAKNLADSLKELDVRVEVDERSEKIGYKIREAQMEKVPYMLVLGDKEEEAGAVAVRVRGKGDVGAMSVDAFRDMVLEAIRTKAQ